MKRLKDQFPLRVYLSKLTPAQQREFAKACGTSVGYLRKYLCRRPKMDVGMAARIAVESRFNVPIESLREDIPWALVKRALGKVAASTAAKQCSGSADAP